MSNHMAQKEYSIVEILKERDIELFPKTENGLQRMLRQVQQLIAKENEYNYRLSSSDIRFLSNAFFRVEDKSYFITFFEKVRDLWIVSGLTEEEAVALDEKQDQRIAASRVLEKLMANPEPNIVSTSIYKTYQRLALGGNVQRSEKQKLQDIQLLYRLSQATLINDELHYLGEISVLNGLRKFSQEKDHISFSYLFMVCRELFPRLLINGPFHNCRVEPNWFKEAALALKNAGNTDLLMALISTASKIVQPESGKEESDKKEFYTEAPPEKEKKKPKLYKKKSSKSAEFDNYYLNSLPLSFMTSLMSDLRELDEPLAKHNQGKYDKQSFSIERLMNEKPEEQPIYRSESLFLLLQGTPGTEVFYTEDLWLTGTSLLFRGDRENLTEFVRVYKSREEMEPFLKNLLQATVNRDARENDPELEYDQIFCNLLQRFSVEVPQSLAHLIKEEKRGRPKYARQEPQPA